MVLAVKQSGASVLAIFTNLTSIVGTYLLYEVVKFYRIPPLHVK